MTTETTAGAENTNTAPTTAPDSGTAPEGQGSENTLLTTSDTQAETQTTDGGTTEGEPKTEGETEAKPEDTGPPEKYEFTDVGDETIDGSVKEAFSEVARELGLSQDKAQGVLDKMAPAIAKANQTQLAALSSQWEEMSKTDSEFGGDKFNENMATAKKALDEFGTPELSKILVGARLGNHPEVIRLLYRAGKAISSDRIITGKGAADGKPSGDKFGDMASRLYEKTQ